MEVTDDSLYSRALSLLPGGVNSPVRAFRATGLAPVFVKRARGAKLYTEDGRVLTDYVMSWGAAILGHDATPVRKAVAKALPLGTSYGLCHRFEADLAEIIRSRIPSMERIRFVNSGTEAVMSALRLARGFTGRQLIVKFDGCYHGHGDAMLVSAGSGVGDIPSASSAGVPAEAVSQTLSIPYNDADALNALFRVRGKEIAAVIVEPVAGNMGLVPPAPGFLETLRARCTESGALLIFDEVITGFRLHAGGAQDLLGVQPDLTTLGKIIGGGLPVGAFGGRTEIMALLAPNGPVYQAGTLSGNPLAMRAGIAALSELIRHPETYHRMDSLTENLAEGIRKSTHWTVHRLGSMFTVFFTEKSVTDFASAQAQDWEAWKRAFSALYREGILFPPALFETAFLSAAHRERDLERVLRVLAGTAV
jgi:glutamate-1-semialdehyde 2,1-aminomutase